MEKQTVRICNRTAWQLGIRPGMKQGGVRALTDHVMLLERQHESERRTLRALAISLLQYTPMLTLADESTLLLDIGASLTLFGGIRRLYRSIEHSTALHALTARYGMASQSRAAWLFARHAGRSRRYYGWRCLNPARTAQRLDVLPLTLLPAARIQSGWLHGIGCRTLGTLRALPRAGLRQRSPLSVTGPGSGGERDDSILLQLDQAYGMASWPCQWLEVAPQFDQDMTLPAPVDHSGAALFAIRRLVAQMTGWLCSRQQAFSGLTLWLTPEPLPLWHVNGDLKLIQYFAS